MVLSVMLGCEAADPADGAEHEPYDAPASPELETEADSSSQLTSEASSTTCSLQGVPLPVEVTWVGLEAEGAIVQAPTGQLGIAVQSVVDDPVDVALTAVIDADEHRLEVPLPAISVAPHDSSIVELDVSALAVQPNALQYAALVRLKGTASSNGKVRNLTPPRAYIHGMDGTDGVVAYGPDVLESQFENGVLAGSTDFGVGADPQVRRVGFGRVVEGDLPDEDGDVEAGEEVP